MKTHRCKESVAHHISIRFSTDDWRKNQWRLFKPTEDYDSLSMWLNDVCEVHYCPFCGKKLSDEERSNNEKRS